VAKHRRPKRRLARQAILTGAAAVGVSSALVLGHATNNDVMVQLTNLVIGSGGLGDTTGVRVPNKLDGKAVPAGFGYVGSFYPAGLDLGASRDAGVPILHQAILSANNGQLVIGMGYSEGTLVIEQERRNLQAIDPASSAPSNTTLGFVQIASPFPPNGGIFGRFPGIGIPLLIDGMGPGAATRYDTTYITNEYDPYGDFPAYFNPLTLLNTALGLRYAHPDEQYDPIVPGTTPAISTTVTNSAGGHDTYVLFYNPHLPLLGPLRDLAASIGLTPFTEPLLSAIEPLLRVAVDMGYTDRQNLNPGALTPFSLFTPPAKILEALGQIPGALNQGVNNLLNGGQQAISPLSQPNALSVSAASVPEVGSVDVSASRMAITSAPEQVQAADDAKDAKDAETSSPPATPPAAAASDSTVKPKPKPSSTPSESTGDGLHPTVTADGNKVTPGGSPGTPAGPDKTPETTPLDTKTPDTKAPTDTKSSNTTATTSTTTSTTAGSTPEKSTPGASATGSGDEGGHSAAA
jgi:diacyltrehalose acyltransferase